MITGTGTPFAKKRWGDAFYFLAQDYLFYVHQDPADAALTLVVFALVWMTCSRPGAMAKVGLCMATCLLILTARI